MSCPYTSLRTVRLNILFGPPITSFVAYCSRHLFPSEGLHTATYLLNHLPSKAIATPSPYVTMYGTVPSYEHLQVFGCACYPNLLSPPPPFFIGNASYHKRYHCLKLSTNRIMISRHVVLDGATSLFFLKLLILLMIWMFFLSRP